MKILAKLPSWLTNKYIIAIAVFAALLLFLDKNDLFTRAARNRELKELEQSKARYVKEINELSAERNNLQKNPQVIEKYAREQYLMKKDNEDLFLIEENNSPTNN